jgi:TIR domain/Pentapeptide repeats (8 copies)
MADEDQLRILKQGAAVWNVWRSQVDNISIDLRGADLRVSLLNKEDRLTLADLLREADFREAFLNKANLSAADLFEAFFNKADLSAADLTGANLRKADLTGANLHGVALRGVDLREADLSAANLSGADLSGADLSRANLREANFRRADLREVNLCEVKFIGTTLSDVDLSGCKNLESIRHVTSSSIDIPTLQRSGPLPLAFLRGVGLPDALIDHLPSLLQQAIQHYSCFISYSSKDGEFAHRLHADLQDKGVRCWFAPHDMKIGAKILDTLDEAIRLRDKVLLVLSEASIASAWVEDEVTKAFAEERQRGGLVLFPVRLDDVVFATHEAWALKLRNNRNIGDFRAWKDRDAYQRTLERLLCDLRVETSGHHVRGGAPMQRI